MSDKTKRSGFWVPLLLGGLLIFACGEKSEGSNAASPGSIKGGDIKVTFIELGSDSCLPCRAMQPILKQVAEEFAGQVKVIFYDVGTKEGEPYAYKYGIRVIPTQIFLDQYGQEYFRHEGYLPKEKLVQILKLKGVR